jgi:hypothetical protein
VDRPLVRVLDAPPPGWNTLLVEDRNATSGHRPELWLTLTETLGGMRLRFIAVEDRGLLLGGGAVMIERRAGFHWIHALPFMLPGAPLARAGAHGAVDAAFGAALSQLQRELRAVGGEWALYRPEGPAPDGAAVEAASGETRFVETSVMELANGSEAAWRRVDRDVRHELRRARARGLCVAEEPDALEEAYALHLAQARHWGGYRPLPLDLSRRLLEATSTLGGVAVPLARLYTVRDPRGLICGMFFLDHPREIFAWWSGSRTGPRVQHAIPYLLWTAARRAHDAGRVRLNLGGSLGRATLASFKQALGARVHRYPVRWLDARRGPWAGRFLAGLQQHLRRGRFRGDRT